METRLIYNLKAELNGYNNKNIKNPTYFQYEFTGWRSRVRSSAFFLFFLTTEMIVV